MSPTPGVGGGGPAGRKGGAAGKAVSESSDDVLLCLGDGAHGVRSSLGERGARAGLLAVVALCLVADAGFLEIAWLTVLLGRLRPGLLLTRVLAGFFIRCQNRAAQKSVSVASIGGCA